MIVRVPAQAILYFRKGSEDVVLWFPEQNEYEGMEGGYRVKDNHIYDADGDEVCTDHQGVCG